MIRCRRNKEAGKATEGKDLRVPNTHLGPALVGRGRGHICVGLIWLVAGSRSGLVGGADGGERSLHYFQQKPSPLSAYSLHPTTRSLPTQAGWPRGRRLGERAGASERAQERQTEGLGLAPRRAGGWVPRDEDWGGRVRSERVEGTRAGRTASERWGLGSGVGWGRGRGGGEQRPSLLTNTSPD